MRNAFVALSKEMILNIDNCVPTYLKEMKHIMMHARLWSDLTF